MVIRSITYTIDFDKLDSDNYLRYVKENINIIKNNFEIQKIKVRTIRFNIIAIETEESLNGISIYNKIEILSNFSKKLGLRWFNLSFNLINKENEFIDKVCKLSLNILDKFDNAFINVLVAKNHINNYAVYKSSKLIKKIALLSDNGIDNFRFGVSLNIEPNAPFFPFSYSNCNDSFSLAIETTKKVVSIIRSKFDNDYISLKNIILNDIKEDLINFEEISNDICKNSNIKYNGQDISLSPYPDEDISVIEILNLLGLDNFGSNGTQFLTSYLTSILKETISTFDIKEIGFNGVMYSLLEDKLMCKANNNGDFTIDSIILYSTVCGCGLDMVPLPGDAMEEEIASIILDVATTSIKLGKPLGVRVLPIPNKNSSNITELELDFLTNTKIPEIKHIHIDKSLFKINKFFVKE